MASSFIQSATLEQGVTEIILNRPEKCNALNGELIKALTASLKEIAQDDSTRVVLLKGNGKYFCAGADIADMTSIANRPFEENVADAKALAELLYTLFNLPKPTIALVHGKVLGGGIGLVAACDIAIAAFDASFCFSEAKIGLAPSVISPYILRAIGERLTRYYFLTAATFPAKKAKKMQLIHHVVDDNELHEKGLELARELIKNSPNALTEIKKLIPFVSVEPLSASLVDYTSELLATLRQTPDAREGLSSFLEKRVPEWK